MAPPFIRFANPRRVPPAAGTDPADRVPLGDILVRSGKLRPGLLHKAQMLSARHGIPLERVLIHKGHQTEQDLTQALAIQWGAEKVDLAATPADPRLVDKLGLETCLAHSVLPWRRVGVATIIATSRPDVFHQLLPALTMQFGTVLMAIAPESEITDALRHVRGLALARRAETFLPARHSCRTWELAMMRAVAVLLVLGVAGLALVAPLATAFASLVLVTFCVMANALLRFVAAGLYLARRDGRTDHEDWTNVPIARLPTISILVPLCREASIAARLIKRLERLDYPPELLDVCLVVEADDHTTRDALSGITLPKWMRQIIVPEGTIRTKPRALNYALDHCHGSIIGIYDAEDAPAPDQLRKVVRRFNSRGPQVACLQGVLDFYNRETNWLSRCFAIDYASWFRVMLPALQRLGWVMPLGGTTVFLRRDALERMGRWDAHNVTEDADLGLRLARFGYRTEMIETVTEEEANCRTWPWIKQRARWIKGYAVTYVVHMRRPRSLLRDLGLWRFVGVQVLFAGALIQVLLAPLLWSFWLGFAGLPHPLIDAMPRDTLLTFAGLMLTAELASITMSLVALRSGPLRRLRGWVPAIHVYAMMGSIAAWKAMIEFVHRPYHWDKTDHGIPPDLRKPRPIRPRGRRRQA